MVNDQQAALSRLLLDYEADWVVQVWLGEYPAAERWAKHALGEIRQSPGPFVKQVREALQVDVGPPLSTGMAVHLCLCLRAVSCLFLSLPSHLVRGRVMYAANRGRQDGEDLYQQLHEELLSGALGRAAETLAEFAATGQGDQLRWVGRNLYRIAHNAARRKRPAEMASPEALPAKPDGGIASVDRRDGLETYIPDGRERQAVMLHLQGYSLREIASSLNCSVTLAWKLFHAGRNRLPPGFLDPS